MCFKSDSTMKKPKGKWGFKVFREGENGELGGDYACPKKERKRGKWLSEKGFKPTKQDLECMGRDAYNGWGIFLNKGDADKWKIGMRWNRGNYDLKTVKVKFKDILDVGDCNDKPVVLARKIFIPSKQGDAS